MSALAEQMNAPLDLIRQKLGADAVLADEASRRFYSNDIFWQPGVLPLAVVLPQTAEEAAAAIGIATQAGIAVTPRRRHVLHQGPCTRTARHCGARQHRVQPDT